MSGFMLPFMLPLGNVLKMLPYDVRRLIDKVLSDVLSEYYIVNLNGVYVWSIICIIFGSMIGATVYYLIQRMGK